MAEQPSTPQINRARMQGNGVGQRELNRQRDPDRNSAGVDEQRLDPFPQDETDAGEERSFAEPELGEGAPANVDVHKLGQDDNPEEDWGEAAGEDAVFSANHTRRGEPTEAARGQGPKTRKANKDIVSNRR